MQLYVTASRNKMKVEKSESSIKKLKDAAEKNVPERPEVQYLKYQSTSCLTTNLKVASAS